MTTVLRSKATGFSTYSGHQASSCVSVYCGNSLEGGGTVGGDDLTHNLYTRLQFTNGETSFYKNTDIPPETIGNIQFDFFQVGGAAFGSVVGGDSSGDRATYKDLVVDPDIWHHALISFAISGSSAQFWQALDDENYDGGYLGPYNKGGGNTIFAAL